ncbi:type II secretion system F family protein [Streptomyces sp. NPDC049881]|uniref:type II secretion system F family protein n=1 Tax=Streptomyces sp. NPDC049881 TaxID=3155778 RepID=UPI0034454E84
MNAPQATATAALALSLPVLAWVLVRERGDRWRRDRLAGLCGRPPARARVAALRRRLRPARPRTDPALPLAAGLLAACLAAGAAPAAAAGAVGAALGGPVGDRLRRVGAELRLGGDPAAVWGSFGTLPGAAGLARRLELAETSGAPVAAAVTAEAAESRARRRRAAQGSARRAAVAVTGPLGLCFLPAFLLIGVVPVVIGLTKELL